MIVIVGMRMRDCRARPFCQRYVRSVVISCVDSAANCYELICFRYCSDLEFQCNKMYRKFVFALILLWCWHYFSCRVIDLAVQQTIAGKPSDLVIHQKAPS